MFCQICCTNKIFEKWNCWLIFLYFCGEDDVLKMTEQYKGSSEILQPFIKNIQIHFFIVSTASSPVRWGYYDIQDLNKNLTSS